MCSIRNWRVMLMSVTRSNFYSAIAWFLIDFSPLQFENRAIPSAPDMGACERVAGRRIGKTVRIRRGPAAVSGDERR